MLFFAIFPRLISSEILSSVFSVGVFFARLLSLNFSLLLSMCFAALIFSSFLEIFLFLASEESPSRSPSETLFFANRESLNTFALFNRSFASFSILFLARSDFLVFSEIFERSVCSDTIFAIRASLIDFESSKRSIFLGTFLARRYSLV